MPAAEAPNSPPSTRSLPPRPKNHPPSQNPPGRSGRRRWGAVDLDGFLRWKLGFCWGNMGKTWGKHGENMGKIAKVHQSSQFLLQLRNTYIIIPFNCWLNILMDHIFLLRLSFAFNKNYVDQKNTFSFFKLETKTLLMAKSHFPIFPGEIPMFPV